MRFNTIYGLLLALPLLTFTACGEDDDDDTGVAGAAGRAGASAAGAAGHAGASVGDAGSESSSGGSSGSGGRAGGGGTGAVGGSTSGEGGAAGESEAGSGGDAGAAGAISSLSDGEILKVLSVVNEGEIAAAQVAQPAAQLAAVKTYATMMITDHTTANAQALALVSSKHIAPAASEVSEHLQAESAALLVTLSQTPAVSFDRVYIESQVKMHAEVLTIIDDSLILGTDDGDLKALLVTTRAAVSNHHDEAETILESL